ncbi:hypothetical protein NRIC_29240 [Enterococcus florum]|uniref:Uncharacterized protein n=1 Tax=Enterococcus florum TaxID=2480627 RepID=A0A4P5PPL0_9ENTE|nr:hypothetical protein NRIC_29240 [Enterococcus florum]
MYIPNEKVLEDCRERIKKYNGIKEEHCCDNDHFGLLMIEAGTELVKFVYQINKKASRSASFFNYAGYATF